MLSVHGQAAEMVSLVKIKLRLIQKMLSRKAGFPGRHPIERRAQENASKGRK